MSTHETPLLGAYALGVLDDDERAAVQRHLADCAECRVELEALEEVRDMAGELPEEALLDGPPDDGDLLLARTLRQVRSEANASRNRSIAIAGVAAAVVIAAVLGTGVVIGRSTSTPVAQPTVTVGPTEAQNVKTRFLSGSDPNTGARLTAKVVPAAGWVRLNVSVTGIPAGERCRVVVVGKDGTREEAGSWLVSPDGAQKGTNLDGAALIAPDDVGSVEIITTEGKRYVSVSA
ncbi:anti-sigma factor family protein [Actinokineospora cianjurensis]|uniref:Putative zinc finger protein n=1 Tax=Actinokineospora cianjurensis TaxID=585224 RepID=A0A421BB46_9PSEU|nr:zf-HC2 domain-containing protein [Actinokineospora cianjurensis]RLK61574.1 putative zinc finger protein [Actinokineospora cianjurensis]